MHVKSYFITLTAILFSGSRSTIASCALVISILLLGLPTGTQARPYVPTTDDAVLERLPEKTDPAIADLKRLRRALSMQPNNVGLAVRFARQSIEASRATGDPRFLGHAQAALAPWWAANDAPPEVVVLRATIRQSLHDFDSALRDLDRVLTVGPRNGQARLTRASVLTVVGRYDEAARDCAALAGLTLEIVVVTCQAQAASVNGDADKAYADLMQALERARTLSPDLTAWVQTLAAEIAARRGLYPQAENHYRLALAADPKDAYLRGSYADFLMDRGRPREAVALAGSDLRNDALLLRVALAETQISDPTKEEQRLAAQHGEDLAARFAASRARGDVVHRREEARYALHLEHNPPRALALARANWKVQREPADLRILAEAARATGDAAALETVQAWRREHRFQDAALVSALGGS